MKEISSPLFSQYILDGVRMDETPFNALFDCLDGQGTVDIPDGPFANIVDEYLDKKPTSFTYDINKASEYAERILGTPFNRKEVDMDYPVLWTKSAINTFLLDCLFKDGHFTLQDILLMAEWNWNNRPAGNMAAFYDSTVAAGHYLFDLGVKLDRYFIEENRRGCYFDLKARNRMSLRRKCGSTIVPDYSDFIIFIPFENSRLQLGGSALSKVVGQCSGAEMELSDPDYFIDCFEVVRELVEDGVIKAGVAVGRGGLMTAAEKFRGRKGFVMDISGILATSGESDAIKVLFAEQPGVLVQIGRDDCDYFDSQLLLQEVAYYPLGHPDASMNRISLCRDKGKVLGGILESLLNQASEGED